MAIITSLSAKDALPYFKRMVAEAWSDVKEVPNFLRSLTTSKTTTAMAVSIEVQRSWQKVASEVIRGASPNLHRSNRSTEKQYIPPYFSDATLLNDLDAYTRVFGDGVGTVSRNDVVALATGLVANMADIKRLQERAIELQIANALETGIVSTLDGGVDFKRKTASLITNAGADLWTSAAAPALAHLKADAEFIVGQGNSNSGRFNVILGDAALTGLMANTELLAKADLKYVKLMDIGMPTIQSSGAVLHGMLSSGSYVFYLWTYPQTYDFGTKTGQLKDKGHYINPKKYVMLSEDVVLTQWKAAVPTVFGDNRPMLGTRPVFADGWSVHESVSTEKQTHKAIVRVAPLVVPYSVDRIVTRQVVA